MTRYDLVGLWFENSAKKARKGMMAGLTTLVSSRPVPERSSRLNADADGSQNQNIFPLPKSMKGSGSAAYLDIVPTPEGYNHIALYSPANSNTPRFLTSGEWEVSSGIKGVDAKLGLVYVISRL